MNGSGRNPSKRGPQIHAGPLHSAVGVRVEWGVGGGGQSTFAEMRRNPQWE
jgi:hypothetical protein